MQCAGACSCCSGGCLDEISVARGTLSCYAQVPCLQHTTVAVCVLSEPANAQGSSGVTVPVRDQMSCLNQPVRPVQFPRHGSKLKAFLCEEGKNVCLCVYVPSTGRQHPQGCGDWHGTCVSSRA